LREPLFKISWTTMLRSFNQSKRGSQDTSSLERAWILRSGRSKTSYFSRLK
jgi:hypothetical protein